MNNQKKVFSIKEYLALLDDERKSEVKYLHKLIREEAPKLKPYIQYYGNDPVIGYGKYKYRYASGREGEFAKIGLSARKNFLVLYIMATKDGQYLAETYSGKLPKASIGKSCVRFKKLSEVDQKVLRELIREASQTRITNEVKK